MCDLELGAGFVFLLYKNQNFTSNPNHQLRVGSFAQVPCPRVLGHSLRGFLFRHPKAHSLSSWTINCLEKNMLVVLVLANPLGMREIPQSSASR